MGEKEMSRFVLFSAAMMLSSCGATTQLAHTASFDPNAVVSEGASCSDITEAGRSFYPQCLSGDDTIPTAQDVEILNVKCRLLTADARLVHAKWCQRSDELNIVPASVTAPPTEPNFGQTTAGSQVSGTSASRTKDGTFTDAEVPLANAIARETGGVKETTVQIPGYTSSAGNLSGVSTVQR